MACEAIRSGSHFLAATLTNIDCQSRAIGAYGFGALADPSSPVAQALTAILTIFVALFGMRLIVARNLTAPDLFDDVVRVGLFLALATSWPAWRVVAYDLVLDGPVQVAGSIGRAASLPGATNDLVARLQDADDGMVALTMFGSGRLTGGVSGGSDLGDVTSGIALADQNALGWGRATFLATVIGVNGLLRLGGGFLLALAPLMAGLLLFAGTRAIFMGWVRSLGFCALGTLAFSVTAGVELALLFPWLTDVLSQRQANVLTPSAPTELFVLALAFALSSAGTLFLISRLMFLPGLTAIRSEHRSRADAAHAAPAEWLPSSPDLALARTSRTQAVVSALETSLRLEGAAPPVQRNASPPRDRSSAGEDRREPAAALTAGTPLGESWRRTTRRSSTAGQRRDLA